MTYYEQQLAQINMPGGITKIQLSGPSLNGENITTNWMDLNQESIDALRDFLDVVESELS